MEERNLKYEAIPIEIPANTNSGQGKKDLPKGKCKWVAFFPFGSIPAQNINLSVEDTQGNPVTDTVDVRDFLKGTSGGLNAYKQVNFTTNGLLRVNLFSPEILTKKFNGQFLFVIDTNG